MPPTRTQRWLDLLSFLLGRRVPVPVEELMERIPAYAAKWIDGDETSRATARRTFERDKDDLKRLGVPLEPVPYAIGGGAEQYEGYRISHRDFYLPYLQVLTGDEAPASQGHEPGQHPYPGVPALDLSAAEAEVALEALRGAARVPAFPFAEEAASALRKLTFDLGSQGPAGDPVVWVEPPGAREVLTRLRTISGALLARKRIGFTYHGIERGRTTQREVAPYGVFFQRDWYLVGLDEQAGGLRVFRVSRMDDLVPNPRSPKSPDYEIPGDFSLRDHLGLRAWELGDDDPPRLVEVRFRYPVSLRMERNGEGELVREEIDGGSVRRFRVTRPDPFLRWLLSLAGEAEILDPPDLREELQRLALAVAASYAEEVVTHG